MGVNAVLAYDRFDFKYRTKTAETFFKISSFVFFRKQVIQVWNDLMVSE